MSGMTLGVSKDSIEVLWLPRDLHKKIMLYNLNASLSCHCVNIFAF